MKEKGYAALVVFFIIIIFISAGIVGGSFYIKNNRSELIPTKKTAQSVNTVFQQTTPRSPQPTSNLQATKNPESNIYISTLLSNLTTSTALEFNDSITTMLDRCKGIATYKGIVQNSDAYSMSQSKFTADTIQYCSVGLKEIYNETYWIGDKIYYKQYPNKPFAIKNPGDSIAIGDSPKEHIERILPDLQTIRTLPVNPSNPGTIKFEGVNNRRMQVVYTIIIENNQIKQLTYQTADTNDPTLGSYSISGMITFSIPQTKIITPQL